MSFQPMTSRVTQGAERATVTVFHHPAQSYSRAVQPRAFREAKRVLRGTWVLAHVDYDAPLLAPGTAETTYLFLPVAVGQRPQDVVDAWQQAQAVAP